MMAAVMVALLSGLWLADKYIERGGGITWPSALSRGGFRRHHRDKPRTDP